MMDWQEIAALAIVCVTAALLVRGFTRNARPSCGDNCPALMMRRRAAAEKIPSDG